MTESRSQKYRRLRCERGLCSKCPNSRRANSLSCEKCADKDRKRFSKQVAQGLCRQCRKPRDNKSSVKCSSCNVNVRLNRLKKLGLNEQEIEKASKYLRNHDGTCDSCGTTAPGGRGEWCLDHKDKKFRGIICCGCNSAIGHAGESPERLEMIADYVRDRRG